MNSLRRLAPLVLLLASTVSAQQANPTPCRRPAPKQFAPGSTLTISEAKSFPCQIDLHDTGVELRADPEGKVANILWSVARDSRGRYYTAAGFGEVTVWGPDGKVLQSIGREGGGPGEFRKGVLLFAVDALDNLYVRDNGLRIAMFSPNYKLLRTVGASGISNISPFSQFIAPFTMLTSEVEYGKENWKYFQVYDLSVGSAVNPPVVRAFGDVLQSERAKSSSDRRRAITVPRDGQFWAGPPRAKGRGYELQLWSVDGALIRTIQREVPWFGKGSDLTGKSTAFFSPPPPTFIQMVRDDGHGLLFVQVRVTNDKWDAVMSAKTGGANTPEMESMRHRATDIYLEVIDANAGVVLASSAPISAEKVNSGMSLLQGWFRTGWSGYRLTEDADGLPVVKMLEVRLTGH